MEKAAVNVAIRKGVVVWLTGMSGSGKTTIARALAARVQADGSRSIVLDGDVLREGLNSDLGFSDEDRTENVRRVAHVAELFCNEGYVVVTATISPNLEHRESARNIIGEDAFVEVFLDTPLEVCVRRDPKGLYERARRGEIKQLTGIGAPYYRPRNPHLVLHTEGVEVEQNVRQVVDYLVRAVREEARSPRSTGPFRH